MLSLLLKNVRQLDAECSQTLGVDEGSSPSNSMYDWWVRFRYPIELAPTGSSGINYLNLVQNQPRLSGDLSCCIL
jgi:hypothetical protein